jgi:hypothetical protein
MSGDGFGTSAPGEPKPPFLRKNAEHSLRWETDRYPSFAPTVRSASRVEGQTILETLGGSLCETSTNGKRVPARGPPGCATRAIDC